jgi:hypothetical protein
LSPGPGYYSSPDSSASPVKDRVISYKFSETKRGGMDKSERLGPGAYDPDEHKKIGGKDAKGVTIRGRPAEGSRLDSPGPGGYSPTETHTKNKVITYSMGKQSKREDMVSKSMRD